jgi:hypothetical protein
MGSRGEGMALLPGGHLLVAKEKAYRCSFDLLLRRHRWRREPRSMILLNSAASDGVKFPAATASKTEIAAPNASVGDCTLASAKGTTRSLRGAINRSMTSRMAVPSPALAISIVLRVMACASPSSKTSIASVVLFRAPLGLPEGLPLLPGLQTPPVSEAPS